MAESPTADWTWIDEAAIRFERAWKAGQRPRIEDFLVEVGESGWLPLLEELLRVERELVQRSGAKPDAEDYRRRFPDSAAVIDAVFGLQAAQSATTDSPHQTPDPTTEGPATPDGEPAPAPGTRVRYFGDYELLDLLGRGGMGLVYRARQLSLNRPVAIKMLQAGILATEDDLRRFQNEAEAVAQLDHPHIVPILEVGRYEDQRYFSMKLIGGLSLDRRLAEFTTDPKSSARLVRTVAEAVHHAHQRGILHRDLKPGNILLDERGAPHVTDFGLAKRVQADSELTQSGAILGTPAYMAPEQTSGKRGMVTTATDVYGLGAILYALLTGRAPFGGDTPVETLEQVRDRTPDSPSKHNPVVERDLEVICLKCLEKDATRRYPSAQALADDLRRYLDGESILARPVSLATRAWMWCKRNQALARLALALMLALLILAFFGIGLVVIAAGRRREAEARATSQSNFRLANRAIRDYLTSVSQNALLKQQDSVDIRGLRRELLETALKYHKDFVKQRGDDPQIRQELAEAHFRIGEVATEISTTDEAIASFNAALAIWEALAAIAPADPDLRRRMADCHLAIGQRLTADKEFLAAMTSLERARSILEPLSTQHPKVASDEANLAACYHEMGIAEAGRNLPERGLESLQKAETIQRRLIGRFPEDVEYRKKLADMINVQGFVNYQRNNYPAALRSFQEVRGICQSLLDGIKSGPKPVQLLNSLAMSHYNIATIELKNNRLEAALASFERSLEYRSVLVFTYPSVIHHRVVLGETLNELGTLLHRVGRDRKALGSIEKAIDILTKVGPFQPDQSRFRASLARSWNILGYLHDEARDNAQAITAFTRAIAELELAVAESPNVVEYKEELCSELENLGEQYIDLGKFAEGLPLYLRAADTQANLVTAHRGDRGLALKAAESLWKLGAIQRHAGDSAGARDSFASAHEVLESIAGNSTEDSEVQGRLGAVLTGEAMALVNLGQTREGLKILERAVAILKPIGTASTARDQARDWLTESLWHLGRLLRASRSPAEADLLDAERQLIWKDRAPLDLAKLALEQTRRAALIGYGKTPIDGQAESVRRLDLDQAADNLRMAVSLGFRDLAVLRADPDSWLLLSRDDIKSLLMDLDFPLWPFDKNR